MANKAKSEWRLSVSLGASLLGRIEELARAEDRSLSSMCTRLIRMGITKLESQRDDG